MDTDRKHYPHYSDWVNGVIWRNYRRYGHIACDKIDDTVVAPITMVGVMHPTSLRLEPNGNYTGRFGTLAKAKYRFTLKSPVDVAPELTCAWDTGMRNLRRLTRGIARTRNTKYFFIDYSNGLTGLRLSSPARPTIAERKRLLSWPLPDNEVYHAQLKKLSCDHIINALPLFDQKKHLVESQDYTETLAGALIKVTFHLEHYSFGGSKGPRYYERASDTFSAIVHEITVLEAEESRLYKSPTVKYESDKSAVKLEPQDDDRAFGQPTYMFMKEEVESSQ
ncbi:hypothetical protein P691DRAFT_771203 [Macrolepiota fuliginosa MF-IS2]|uniref:Uncharacterized protein n=1 Tax=Macrolepiota fuliginosa MF-IS2 TaxID=1400762 RepID=A0A9P5XLK8_9AGAR|nr:hypothetical protein P691DRAFT_771203 [Macrolepiota fuliginosa MF-IS2]